MPSSRSIRLSPEAEDDIQNIVQFTIESWGVEAGKRYSESIWSTLQRLAIFPEVGTELLGPLRGFRRFLVGSHLIFYTLDDEGVGVVRILHRRMDAVTIIGE